MLIQFPQLKKEVLIDNTLFQKLNLARNLCRGVRTLFFFLFWLLNNNNSSTKTKQKR